MSFRERWTKKFAELLTEEEKKAFKLWLDFSEGKITESEFKKKMDIFSEGKITESEFKKKMDIKVMPRMLGKMSAARVNALEDEVESLRRRVDALEKKIRKI